VLKLIKDYKLQQGNNRGSAEKNKRKKQRAGS